MQNLAKHRLELIVCIAALSMLGYFGWQGVSGPRSFHFREQLDRHDAQLKADLATVQAQRQVLESRVQQMRPESVDADLVDQFARANLNMAAANDYVVLLKP